MPLKSNNNQQRHKKARIVPTNPIPTNSQTAKTQQNTFKTKA